MPEAHSTSSSLTIRPTTPEDDDRIMAIHNAIDSELPPISVEQYREWLASQPQGMPLERYVAEIDGIIVGSMDLREQPWMKRAGTAFIDLEVDEPWRGRGVGSRLYELLGERSTALGLRRLYTEIREDLPESLAFAERRGFRRTGRADRMSRLDVQGANLSAFADGDDRLRDAGIHIATLEEIGMEDERFMRAFHAMESQSNRDMPASEETEDSPYEEWLPRIVHGAGSSPRMIWIALDGDRPVGVARLRLRGERAAMNRYTGVDPAYRGRGIAKALKLRTVLWARENDIDYLYTGNDVENHPMLAINVALGYQPLPVRIEVLKEL